jgi:hypothetical protein
MASHGYDLRMDYGHHSQGHRPPPHGPQYPFHQPGEGVAHSGRHPAALGHQAPRPFQHLQAPPHQQYYVSSLQQPYTQSYNNISLQQAAVVSTSPAPGGPPNLSHSQQKSAAAAFFARKAAAQVKQQVLMQAAADRLAAHSSEDEDEESGRRLRTNFRAIICRAPPAVPAGLLARLESEDLAAGGVGRVRVMLRIVAPDSSCRRPMDNGGDSGGNERQRSYFSIDKKRRQVCTKF